MARPRKPRKPDPSREIAALRHAAEECKFGGYAHDAIVVEYEDIVDRYAAMYRHYYDPVYLASSNICARHRNEASHGAAIYHAFADFYALESGRLARALRKEDEGA